MPIKKGLGRLKLIFTLFLVLIVLLVSILTVNKQTSTDNVTTEVAEVTGIIDGDTFFIKGSEKVRLICVDAPEFGDPGYWPARKFLEDKIKGQNVTLVKDFSERDNYDRLLRYVYLNETLINELLVLEGLAKYYPYGPDVSLCPKIREAENYAWENNLGIWNMGN
ncbi:MAG: thermonuclease family protein [Nanoarchaeota archaeon]|nr:thermonuclease family protein [Nanoarchaeota archaeon]